MIHQVSPDHVAAVGDALAGPALVLRHQEQPRRLDGVCGDDIDFGFDASFPRPRPGLLLVFDEFNLADAFVLDDDLAGDRVIDQLRAAVGRFVQCDCRIIFGLDRADRNAIGISGAGAAIAVRLGIARRRQAANLDRGDGLPHSEKFGLVFRQLRESFADALIEQRRRNPRHFVGVAFGKIDAEKALLIHISGNTELSLRPGIKCAQFLRGDVFWPIRKREVRRVLAIARFHGEIARHKSQGRSEPMRRAAGDAIVGAGEGSRPLLNEITLFGILPALGA